MHIGIFNGNRELIWPCSTIWGGGGDLLVNNSAVRCTLDRSPSLATSVHCARRVRNTCPNLEHELLFTRSPKNPTAIYCMHILTDITKHKLCYLPTALHPVFGVRGARATRPVHKESCKIHKVRRRHAHAFIFAHRITLIPFLWARTRARFFVCSKCVWPRGRA